jgi:hypothetical protein
VFLEDDHHQDTLSVDRLREMSGLIHTVFVYNTLGSVETGTPQARDEVFIEVLV